LAAAMKIERERTRGGSDLESQRQGISSTDSDKAVVVIMAMAGFLLPFSYFWQGTMKGRRWLGAARSATESKRAEAVMMMLDGGCCLGQFDCSVACLLWVIVVVNP
jgi:hypothetical protein